MFLDVTQFREKMAILVRHYNLLTDEERGIVERALQAYEEMERLLERVGERTEQKFVRSDE